MQNKERGGHATKPIFPPHTHTDTQQCAVDIQEQICIYIVFADGLWACRTCTNTQGNVMCKMALQQSEEVFGQGAAQILQPESTWCIWQGKSD